ncbi:MAG: aromatic hydrocarbon degradation protein, partial [Azoarcus sp.]|nr:aromatic hydrocarbon degradation protein [Azoarcus sp.]
MSTSKNLLRRLPLLVALGLPLAASATPGTFPHGYGVKAEGMGGVSIALPQDAVAGANNPAGMVLVGDRFDAGAAILKVDNGASFAGTDY